MFTLEESVIIIFASLVGLCFLVLVIFFIIHKLFKKSPKKRPEKQIRKIYSNRSTLNIQKYYFESDAIQLKNVENFKSKHFEQRPNFQDGLFKSSLYSSRSRIIEPGLARSPKTCPPVRRVLGKEGDVCSHSSKTHDINQCHRGRFYGAALDDHEEILSPPGFPRRSRTCTRSQMRSYTSSQNQMATISRSHRHQPPHGRLIINNSLRSYGSVVDELEALAIQTPNYVQPIFDPKSTRSPVIVSTPDHNNDQYWQNQISDHSNNESLSSASRLYHHMDMIRSYPNELKSPPSQHLHSPLQSHISNQDDLGSQISDLITADEFLSTISHKNNKPFQPSANFFQRNHPMQYRSFNIKTSSNANLKRQQNSNTGIVKIPRENNFYLGKNSNISKVSTFQSGNSKTNLRPSVSVRSLTTTASICEDAPYFWDDFDLKNIKDFTENPSDKNNFSNDTLKNEVFVQNVEADISNETLAENDEDEDDFIETLPENDENVSSNSNLHTICEIEDDL